jgi:3-oxoacyl-[acyl-carrier-protein] synthase-3
MTRFSRITGTGSFLPPRRLTNADLVAELASQGVETSDDWIVERTGIHARHFAAPDVSSSDLAFEAAKHALVAAGRSPQDIDLIIVATSTPDMVFPSTACLLQHKLAQIDEAAAGIAGAPAFDVQAVCSGFIYALTVADAMIRAGSATRALVLEASNQPGILATDIHADGKHAGILCVPGHVRGGEVLGDPVLKMDGQAVFKLAVGLLEGAARAALNKAGLQDSDIDWLIPHQANIRIIQSTAKKLKLPMDKVVLTVHNHGNTSAASIPLALDEAVRSGQVKPGQTLMLEGVGGGFTWGAVLLKL